MQISFANYFNVFSQWKYKIYWIAGDDDGVMDVDARLQAMIVQSGSKVKRLQIATQKDLSLLRESLCSNDLFGLDETLWLICSKAMIKSILEWMMNNRELLTKMVIFSPKLSTDQKKNQLFQNPDIALYHIWPLTTQQVGQWWRQACQSCKLNVPSDISKQALMQSGFRVDRLKSYLDRWKLLFPEGGTVDRIDTVANEPTQHHYQWAAAWLKGLNVNHFLNDAQIDKSFFALRYYVDELVSFDFYKNLKMPQSDINKKLRWWPQKSKDMMLIYEKHSSKSLHQLAFRIMTIDLCRIGQLPLNYHHTFKTLIHHQSIYDELIPCEVH